MCPHPDSSPNVRQFMYRPGVSAHRTRYCPHITWPDAAYGDKDLYARQTPIVQYPTIPDNSCGYCRIDDNPWRAASHLRDGMGLARRDNGRAGGIVVTGAAIATDPHAPSDSPPAALALPRIEGGGGRPWSRDAWGSITGSEPTRRRDAGLPRRRRRSRCPSPCPGHEHAPAGTGAGCRPTRPLVMCLCRLCDRGCRSQSPHGALCFAIAAIRAAVSRRSGPLAWRLLSGIPGGHWGR